METAAQLAVMAIPAQTHLLVITLAGPVAAGALKMFLRPVVAAKAATLVAAVAAAQHHAVRSIQAPAVMAVTVTFEW